MASKLNYGTNPFVCPEIPEQAILGADPEALRLLLLIAQDKDLLSAPLETLAERAGLSKERTKKALASLGGLGLISIDLPELSAKKEAPKPEVEPPKKEEKKTKVSELPTYTDAEFAALLEKRSELSELITEAQNTLGKIFNVNETKILVSLAEEFGFDEEFLLVLLDFCRKNDRKNLRYIEKLATSLYDSDVRTTEALVEYLHRREAQDTAQGKVRSIFGIGSRALTGKEKDFIARWTETYGFDFPMIEKAYEITVNNTSKPSLSYANKILESWYSEGLKTPEEVDGAQAKKNGEKPAGMSFDVDEFFKAALERSYREGEK